MRKIFTYLLIATLFTTTTTPMVYTTYASETKQQSPAEWFIIENGVLKGFDFTYIDEHSMTIPSSISIPEGVTTIGTKAFSSRYIKELTLPSTLTTIEEMAFSATYFESIVLPESLTKIGEGAFRYTKFKHITIPSKITTIEKDVFFYSQLETITFNNKLTTIGDAAFKGSKLQKITLPASLTTIGKQAFTVCPELKEVNLNEGLKTIGESAFDSTGIESILIPSTVSSIGNSAFKQSASLNTIINKATSQTVGTNLFSAHEGLKYIYCYDTNTTFKLGAQAAGYIFKDLSDPANQPEVDKPVVDKPVSSPGTVISDKLSIGYDVKTVNSGDKPIGPIVSIYRDLLNEQPNSSNSKALKRADSFLSKFNESCIAYFKN